MGANLSSSKHAIMKNPVSEKLVDQYSLMFRDLGNDLWIGHYNVHGLIPGYDSFNYPDDIGDEEVIKVNLLFIMRTQRLDKNTMRTKMLSYLAWSEPTQHILQRADQDFYHSIYKHIIESHGSIRNTMH